MASSAAAYQSRSDRPAPLVGRQRELAMLDAAARIARSGRLQSVAVSGAFGVGKTALLERFLDAQLSNEKPPPAIHWIDAAQDQPGARRVSQQGIVHIAADALERATPTRPTILVLDDLQQAGQAVHQLSAVIAHAAAAATPAAAALVIFAFDDSRRADRQRLAAAMSRLPQHGHLSLRLGPLTWNDATALLSSWSEGNAGWQLAHAVETAAGIPLLLRELAPSLLPTPRMTQLVRRRMSELTPAAQRVLVLLAMAPRHTSMAMASAVLDLDHERLLRLAEECADTGLAVPTSDPSYEQAAVAAGAPAARRLRQRQLRQRQLPFRVVAPIIADIIRRQVGPRPLQSVYAGALAHSAAERGPRAVHSQPLPSSAQHACTFSVSAGEAAAARDATDEALRHFEHAILLGAGRDGVATGRAHRGIARALLERHLWGVSDRPLMRSVSSLRAAYEQFVAAGRGDEALAVVLSDSVPMMRPQLDGVIHEMQREALALVAPGSADHAQLLCAMAISYYFSSEDYPGAVTRHRAALRVANALADPVLHYAIERDFSWTSSVGRCEDPQAGGRFAVLSQLAAAAGDHDGARGHLLKAADSAVRTGRPGYAAELLERAGVPTGLLPAAGDDAALSVCAHLFLLQARWEPARAAFAGLQAPGPIDRLRAALCRAYCEDPAAAFDDVAGFEHAGVPLVFDLAAAMALGVMARLTPPGVDPQSVVARIEALGQRSYGYHGGRIHTCSALAHWVIVTEDRARAAMLRAELTGLFYDEPLIAWGADVCISRLLGLLAHVAGEHEVAVAELEASLAFAQSAGYVTEQVWSGHDLAVALAGRGARGDLARAAAHMGRAQQLAEQHGLRGLSGLFANWHRARHDGAALPRPSKREREVLLLVAKGFTNAEIGDYLDISPHTVKHHVAAICHKLGVANRAEAASYATAQGML